MFASKGGSQLGSSKPSPQNSYRFFATNTKRSSRISQNFRSIETHSRVLLDGLASLKDIFPGSGVPGILRFSLGRGRDSGP
jgi:hypothetical protein